MTSDFTAIKNGWPKTKAVARTVHDWLSSNEYPFNARFKWQTHAHHYSSDLLEGVDKCTVSCLNVIKIRNIKTNNFV